MGENTLVLENMMDIKMTVRMVGFLKRVRAQRILSPVLTHSCENSFNCWAFKFSWLYFLQYPLAWLFISCVETHFLATCQKKKKSSRSETSTWRISVLFGWLYDKVQELASQSTVSEANNSERKNKSKVSSWVYAYTALLTKGTPVCANLVIKSQAEDPPLPKKKRVPHTTHCCL